MDFIFSVRRKKGSMECVMDLPCFGEAELVYDRGEDFDYCEGSLMFWSKFGAGDRVFKVSDFQPDFVHNLWQRG